MVAERDPKTCHFLPGNTGSGKGGRPKGLAEKARAATYDGDGLIAFFVAVMASETADLGERMDAAKWLADRGWGRAVQMIDANISPIAKVYEGLDIDAI